jgi:hypothetical protein
MSRVKSRFDKADPCIVTKQQAFICLTEIPAILTGDLLGIFGKRMTIKPDQSPITSDPEKSKIILGHMSDLVRGKTAGLSKIGDVQVLRVKSKLHPQAQDDY